METVRTIPYSQNERQVNPHYKRNYSGEQFWPFHQLFWQSSRKVNAQRHARQHASQLSKELKTPKRAVPSDTDSYF